MFWVCAPLPLLNSITGIANHQVRGFFEDLQLGTWDPTNTMIWWVCTKGIDSCQANQEQCVDPDSLVFKDYIPCPKIIKRNITLPISIVFLLSFLFLSLKLSTLHSSDSTKFIFPFCEASALTLSRNKFFLKLYKFLHIQFQLKKIITQISNAKTLIGTWLGSIYMHFIFLVHKWCKDDQEWNIDYLKDPNYKKKKKIKKWYGSNNWTFFVPGRGPDYITIIHNIHKN